MSNFKSIALQFLSDEIPKKSKKTQEEYQRQIKKLIYVFGEMEMKEIKPIHIRKYFDLRAPKIAANREMALFSKIFNFAREKNLTDAPNPTAGIAKNSETPRDKYINDDEFRSLMHAADPILKNVLLLSYFTGQRIADVLKMSTADIALNHLIVKQNKTGAIVRIKIDGEFKTFLESILCEWDKGDRALILDERGKPLGRCALRYRFEKARKKANLKNIQIRDLRAKAATDTFMTNGYEAARRLMGHTRISMTERYIRSRLGIAAEPLANVFHLVEKS